MQRVTIDESKTIRINADTVVDAEKTEKIKECCYNKDDECQLGYGKCSSISKCFTLE